MNISRFLTKKEDISGLSIEDNSIFFMNLKRGGWLTHTPMIENIAFEELAPGTITLGVVTDRKALTESIQRVVPKKGRGTNFTILTIPTHEVYTTIIPFPSALQDEKLKETVDLAIQYQIPFAVADAYIDWEKIPGSTNGMTDVFIAATPKKIVDEYVGACTDAGISVVAVEFHSMSVLRAIPKDSLPVFIADTHPESIAAYILADQSLRYQTVIQRKLVPDIKEEFRRMADFYESKEGKKVPIMTLRELPLPLAPSFPPEAIELNGGKWLPVLGAALRGFRPREDDAYISLLSVGTEEAYALNRALSFAQVIRMAMFTFVFFLIIAYGGVWLMIVTLQKQSNDQIAANTELSEGSDATEVEKKVTEINALIDAIYMAVLESPHTDLMFDDIISASAPGITIQNTQWSTPEGAITMQGVAKTREDLNNFRKVLQGSEKFSNILLPITNIEQRLDIPFTISMNFIDPLRFIQAP